MIEECNWDEVTRGVSATRNLVGGLSSTHDEVEIVEFYGSNPWDFGSVSFHSIFKRVLVFELLRRVLWFFIQIIFQIFAALTRSSGILTILHPSCLIFESICNVRAAFLTTIHNTDSFNITFPSLV